MSTLSSANVTDVNLVLKERTHVHLCLNMLIFTHNLGNWLMPRQNKLWTVYTCVCSRNALTRTGTRFGSKLVAMVTVILTVRALVSSSSYWWIAFSDGPLSIVARLGSHRATCLKTNCKSLIEKLIVCWCQRPCRNHKYHYESITLH